MEKSAPVTYNVDSWKDDLDTLIGCDIPYIDGNLELHKVSGEAYIGF